MTACARPRPRRLIERIEPGSADDEPMAVFDVFGRLVLPGLVDAHCHLDKTQYGGPWVPHSAGAALEDRIAKSLRSMTATSTSSGRA